MSRNKYQEFLDAIDDAIDGFGFVPNLPGALGEEALQLLQDIESFREKVEEEGEEA